LVHQLDEKGQIKAKRDAADSARRLSPGLTRQDDVGFAETLDTEADALGRKLLLAALDQPALAKPKCRSSKDRQRRTGRRTQVMSWQVIAAFLVGAAIGAAFIYSVGFTHL
jgi:hypothetical protein